MARIIAPQSVVDPRAQLDDDVEIGPFCVVGPHVTIGSGTRLQAHVTVLGHVVIGQQNQLYPNVVIGCEPQDISYRGSPARVEIGHGNVIREGVTINRGTDKEAGLTRVGNHNYLMANSHVAHDCWLGDHIVIANGTLLGGHVHVNDYASLSGGVAVHHYATIGSYSFVSGLSRVLHDVPPFLLVEGHPARPRCINAVALKRHRFTPQAIEGLSEAHRLLYRNKVGLAQATEALRSQGRLLPPVVELLKFVESQQEGRHGRAREQGRKAA